MASAEKRGANNTHNKNDYLKEEREKENQREGKRGSKKDIKKRPQRNLQQASPDLAIY